MVAAHLRISVPEWIEEISGNLFNHMGLSPRKRPSPGKRNAKKAIWLPEEGLQIAEKRRGCTGKGEKERHTHLNEEFQRIAQRDKKDFLSDQCKEIKENNRKD